MINIPQKRVARDLDLSQGRRAEKNLRFVSLPNEKGFVAIITTVIITVIVAAIVLSFTLITRREEVQTRDRQLSTQANYAAESGVNYAVKKNLPHSPNTCVPLTYIDANNSISAPCILVNDEPNELLFDEISTERPTVMYETNPVDELDFAWQNPNGTANFSNNYTAGRGGAPLFPTIGAWGSSTVGVVEVVIYPVDLVVNTTNSTLPNRLVDQAKTFYLYPQATGAGTVTGANYSDDGKIIQGSCNSANTPKHCLARINNIPRGGLGQTGSKGYVIRLRSIYNSVSLEMTGYSGGALQSMKGVQKVIDVTGKATDVLRRIQVRLPVRDSYNLPIYTVEAGDNLCKRLSAYPNQPAGYNPDLCP